MISSQAGPTLAGIAAIIMWSALALLTAASGKVPPFQLLAITFAIGSVAGMASWLIRPPAPGWYRQPPLVWVTGTAGLFGYHFFYYTALRNAPVADASLIAYLWPLLIVLMAALLPGERLRLHHAAGALLGFAGAALLISSRGTGDLPLPAGWMTGYAAAFLCAFIWSGYSVMSRHFKAVPTDAVIVYCIATAIFAAACHYFLEDTVWPQSQLEWAAMLGLGLFPVGLAFYAWDHAMKHGPIQLIGSLAYGAPVLSTLILIAAGQAELRWQLMAAAVMVALGAVLASGRLRPQKQGKNAKPA